MTWLGMSFEDFIEDYRHTANRTLDAYRELDLKIEKLTGYSLGNLERLLAAGWTLEPPKGPSNMRDLAELAK